MLSHIKHFSNVVRVFFSLSYIFVLDILHINHLFPYVHISHLGHVVLFSTYDSSHNSVIFTRYYFMCFHFSDEIFSHLKMNSFSHVITYCSGHMMSFDLSSQVQFRNVERTFTCFSHDHSLFT